MYDQEDDFMYLNITPTKLKLGYSAFVILTLLEMDHKDLPLRDYYLEKFANGIMHLQREDGSFQTFFYADESGGEDYYPGEALFALMSLYADGGNRTYLEVVEKAFPYYADYWRANKNTAFVPWQTRAYTLLYEYTNKQDYADLIFEMNDYILESYFPLDNCTDFEFDTSVVAVHMEGVIQAYNLAIELRDNNRASCYRNFTLEGSAFLLTLQITETANFLEEEAVGGFLDSETSESMRVDRNQHAIIALKDAIDAGIIS